MIVIKDIKKKALAGILVGALLPAIIIPWMRLHEQSEVDELQGIAESWSQSHPVGAQLIMVANPEEFYVAYWQSGSDLIVSLYLDGVWVQVATQEIQQEVEPGVESE